MRKFLFNLHLYLALATGMFIAILGLTGSIMAFEQELDHVLHPHRSYVRPQGQPKSLAEVMAIAQKEDPGQQPLVVSMSQYPDIAWAVGFRDAAVYVNQYSGEVLGIDRTNLDFLGYVHQVHLRLATPLWLPNRDRHQIGRQVVSWVGVVCLFLLVSGIYLWWPTKRVRVEWRTGERRSWFDLHNAIGVISLVFLLILTLTGISIGFEDKSEALFYKLTNSHPVERPNLKVTQQPGAKTITADRVMEIARATLPGAAPIFISVPNGRQLVQVSLRYPEDLTPGGRSRIYIDPYTGKVVQFESSRTTAAGTRLVTLNRALHTGDILGVPSKIVMSLASLAIFVQFVSGVVMWWKRTRAGKRARQVTPAAASAS